ncbi:MAG: hypothetical protein WBW81_15785 [Methylocella sp.]
MALTLIVEQRLGDAGLVKFFGAHRNAWKALAKKTYVFLKGNFPAGSEIRRDDVAKGLLPLVEVDEGLRAELHKSKLTQKYWITYFTDLIIDKTWNEITMEEKAK